MQAAPARASDALERWRENPEAFVRDLWGIDMETFQVEALGAIENEGRVSIRSGHGVGKSALIAWSVIWFLCTHFPAKVPVTAPTGHQLDDILRPEIGMWLRRLPSQFQDQFKLTTEKLMLRDAPEESFAAFRTGNKDNPEALQGFHSENLLFCLDEASGIADIVFEVAEGALSTPGARVLMTGNPTRASGYFFDSHHSQRSHFRTMKVPCAESSRVAPDYIERMGRYGIDSNIYRVRVLGEFPLSDEDAVIPLEWVESAVDRDIKVIEGPIAWGLDVARFGDARTALAKRQQNHLLAEIKDWRQKDTMQVSGILKREYEEALPARPADIFIDVIGIGAGVVDRTKEMGLPVRGINVGEQPAIKDQFARYRDELWWRGREWFESRDVCIPNHSELIAELSTVKYEILSTGKIQVHSKERMRRDKMPSPDLADAFLLTLAESRYAKRRWEPIVYNNRGIV